MFTGVFCSETTFEAHSLAATVFQAGDHQSPTSVILSCITYTEDYAYRLTVQTAVVQFHVFLFHIFKAIQYIEGATGKNFLEVLKR